MFHFQDLPSKIPDLASKNVHRIQPDDKNRQIQILHRTGSVNIKKIFIVHYRIFYDIKFLNYRQDYECNKFDNNNNINWQAKARVKYPSLKKKGKPEKNTNNKKQGV